MLGVYQIPAILKQIIRGSQLAGQGIMKQVWGQPGFPRWLLTILFFSLLAPRLWDTGQGGQGGLFAAMSLAALQEGDLIEIAPLADGNSRPCTSCFGKSQTPELYSSAEEALLFQPLGKATLVTRERGVSHPLILALEKGSRVCEICCL